VWILQAMLGSGRIVEGVRAAAVVSGQVELWQLDWVLVFVVAMRDLDCQQTQPL
jgi:hypothetical protein